MKRIVWRACSSMGLGGASSLWGSRIKARASLAVGSRSGQGGFESYLSAAIVKKHVPAVVTQHKENASFVLSSAVLRKEESTGSKVARCLFAYCAGMDGTQTATVQLVNVKTKEVAWAYNVKKHSANAYQSTAEAAAKHLKRFLEEHPQ